jgi:type I restriction enzyme S subunit
METKPAAQLVSGSYNYFENGDILLAKVTPCFENGKKALAAGLENGAGYATSEVHVIRPDLNKIEPRFLLYLLSSENFRAEGMASMTGAGGLRRVSEAAILNHRPKVTGLATQKAIADFLDRETARIDQLIEKKQRLVEVLREREEAGFLDVVTGKDVRGPKMFSGYDWIGEIPSHWSAPKFTQVAKQETGHTPSRKVPEYWRPEECNIPWISLADVWQLRSGERIFIDDTSEKISPFGMENSSARLLPANTVFLSRTASVGFAGIMSKPMATTQDFAAWICGPLIKPKFLYYVLRSMKPEFRRLMMGSTHQTIYMPDIRSFRTPLPSFEEQEAICGRLDDEIGRFRGAASAINSSIDRLREYRAALITAAVTGQVDLATHHRHGATDRALDRIEEEIQP